MDESSCRTGSAHVTSLAKELKEDGYRAVEVDYVTKLFAGDDEAFAKSSSMNKLVYRFVMVEHKGDWYVAEERLIEKIGC